MDSSVRISNSDGLDFLIRHIFHFLLTFEDMLQQKRFQNPGFGLIG